MLKTKEEIKDWLDYYYIRNYTINKDLTVDINGNVDLSIKEVIEDGVDGCIALEKLEKIPVQFNKINGWFDCSDNNLISLKGCPKIVDGNFYCHHNKLKTLEFSPKIVLGDFNFNDNNELPEFFYDMSHKEVLSYYNNLELNKKMLKELPINNIVEKRSKL